ncbi:MAG: mechanosensitive ion channel family protein [Actinomycetota bacterium]|nr:mechanosensitive ion channel family protein [Actinomycetota bacterium]MDH5224428.1 mechanosensitive ion channel family protein [Actinomycetota bacterium]
MGLVATDAVRYSGEWWRDIAIGVGISVLIAIAINVALRIWVRRAHRRAAEVSDDSIEGPRRRRTATVLGLIATTLQVVVWFVVAFYLMSAFGVPLGPLFASAGIVGVALGFGAQTVVKDTLAGVFLALEGQFDVGDVVELQTEGGPVNGTIEGLTLRITSVRQYDGTLSIVPNGSIQVTSNKTRGWGRAIVDVRVALSEDPDNVRAVIEELLVELAEAEPLHSWLRELPKVVGVVQLTEFAQVVRTIAETTPGHRLDAERLLRERITARMTERGLRMPPVPGVSRTAQGDDAKS